MVRFLPERQLEKAFDSDNAVSVKLYATKCLLVLHETLLGYSLSADYLQCGPNVSAHPFASVIERDFLSCVTTT